MYLCAHTRKACSGSGRQVSLPSGTWGWRQVFAIGHRRELEFTPATSAKQRAPMGLLRYAGHSFLQCCLGQLCALLLDSVRIMCADYVSSKHVVACLFQVKL